MGLHSHLLGRVVLLQVVKLSLVECAATEGLLARPAIPVVIFFD